MAKWRVERENKGMFGWKAISPDGYGTIRTTSFARAIQHVHELTDARKALEITDEEEEPVRRAPSAKDVQGILGTDWLGGKTPGELVREHREGETMSDQVTRLQSAVQQMLCELNIYQEQENIGRVREVALDTLETYGLTKEDME